MAIHPLHQDTRQHRRALMESHLRHTRSQALASHRQAQHTRLRRQLTLQQAQHTMEPTRFLQPHLLIHPRHHHTLPRRQATVQHHPSTPQPLQHTTRQVARRHPSTLLRRLSTARLLRHTVQPPLPTRPLHRNTGELREAQIRRLLRLATVPPARYTVRRARRRTSTLLARPRVPSTHPLRLSTHQSKFGRRLSFIWSCVLTSSGSSPRDDA